MEGLVKEKKKENRLTLAKVVDYQRVEGKANEVFIAAENPTIKLSERVDENGKQSISGHIDRGLWVQNGYVYTGENSDPIPYEEIPEWFWALARRCNKEGRDRVGLVLPEENASVNNWKPEPEDEVKQEMYECPEEGCGMSVPLKKKGIHIGQHTRAKNAALRKLSKKKKPAKKKSTKKKKVGNG